jgi:uncharacterized membrane-anchored protein
MTLKEALVVISENGKYLVTDGADDWEIDMLIDAYRASTNSDALDRECSVSGNNVYAIGDDGYMESVAIYSVSICSETEQPIMA